MEAEAIAVSSTSRWRIEVLTCLLGSVVVLLALLLPWKKYSADTGLISLIQIDKDRQLPLMMWLTLLTAGVTLYVSRSLLQRPAPQRRGWERFLWSVPQVVGACPRRGKYHRRRVMTFGGLVFSYSLPTLSGSSLDMRWVSRWR